MPDRDGVLPIPYFVSHTHGCQPLCSAIINLPKVRSVVADPEYPEGENKLVLLRVQHEGASRESSCLPSYRCRVYAAFDLSGTDTLPSVLVDLNADARSYLESHNASLTTYNIELDYDYWTVGSWEACLRERFT